MPPDITQVAGKLGYYWGPNGGLPQGIWPEHIPRDLGYPQRHDLLATLELPALYGTALQY
jgi:hypothetical protein